MELLVALGKQLKDMGMDYAICGGAAIDLFVGRKTRPHKDLDVGVYWQDRDFIVQYMLERGWMVYEPVGAGRLHKIRSASSQKRVKSNIWCVRPGNPHYTFTEREEGLYEVVSDNGEQESMDFIEFLFNTRDDDYFYYARNKCIKRELASAVLNKAGLFFMAPEMVLLYKSTAAGEADYQLDFDNAYPRMDDNQRAWFLDAMATAYPDGHIWLNGNGR